MAEIRIEEILRILPHRYPMLLVDRILESEPGKSVKGIKNVTVNEPFFPGHYPGKPIMPGVLIIESMAQCSAVIVLQQEEFTGKVPLIAAIDKIKFRQPVVPGDQLVIEAELLWMRSSVGRLKAQATVDGSKVAEMELAFKLIDKEQEA